MTIFDKNETDVLTTRLFNSMVKAERTGEPGEEKEKRVLDEVLKSIQDPLIIPGLVSLFGSTKMIPLAIFAIRIIIRILNATLGHDWLDKSKNIKKDEE